MSSPTKRIAIVGAGPSGLSAIKEFTAAGFEVQCFERAHAIGGQWLYDPNPTADTHSSIYNGVILNSCREPSAFGDFPLDPARYPIFYHHSLHLRYLNEFAAHFGLLKHIQFRTTVVGCSPTSEGGWELRIRSENENGTEDEAVLTFDAVVCGTGLGNRPKIPEFPGRAKFKGEVFHSHYYRKPTPLEGKKVVIVGLGPTAIDLACEIGPLAKDLRIVNKRGAWVLPRFILGKPTEALNSRASATWLPFSVQAFLFKQVFNNLVGKQPAVLQPSHHIMAQNAAVRSDFTEKLKSGVFNLHRSDITSFTESGVLLDDGTTLEADVVILSTGYHHADYPFLPPGTIESKDAPAPHIDLYKHIVPPRAKNLFIMGNVEVVGPASAIIEGQARWITAVLQGTIQLPNEEDMMKDIRAFRAWQAKHFINSARHIISVELNSYVDGLLAPLGAVPSAWKLLGRVFTTGKPLRALKVYLAVFFEIQVSAQWRLFGAGSKTELAEETLLRVAAGKEALSDGEKAWLKT
ncbi:dimethylaniline monooxygenase [Colletotrichum truncatum]|uniref:Dimethylaniline monooxygenase n=1 Tax=Colletotrichum truncatum TaxID=5467 RepID=A0ACC3ZFY5_COLTU|nr:dimethylaniline monooxygenase [Colletotrichum truncatum]KAF6801899.1 dimethylaniline monooxygenase [Colletotrichum truncatum]